MSIVHMDLVGRARGTHAILPINITVLRGTTVFREPFDPHCVWNLADNVITSRGDASLLSIMDIGNALRSMSIGDQDRFKFQMSRVLSIARLVEVRCLGLFSGLIEAQRNGREEGAKKKKARREREDMRSELTTAQADIEKAASTLASVRQQYCE